MGPPEQILAVGLAVADGAPREEIALPGVQLHLERICHALGDGRLHGEDVFDHARVFLGPDGLLARDRHEADIDARLLTGHADRALEHRADIERPADLRDVEPGALELGDGGAGDDVEFADGGEGRDQLLGHPIREIFIVRIAAEVHQRQHGEAVDRRGNGGGGGPPEQQCRDDGEPDEACEQRATNGLAAEEKREAVGERPVLFRPRKDHAVDVHGHGDVLQVAGTEFREGVAGLVLDLPGDVLGNTDAAGVSERLDACRDVHAVAEHIVLLVDDVAGVQPDAQQHAVVRLGGPVVRVQGRLDGNGAGGGGEGAGKLHEEGVTDGLDFPAAVRCEKRADEPPVGLEKLQGQPFVPLGEGAVAHHVGEHDDREAPLGRGGRRRTGVAGRGRCFWIHGNGKMRARPKGCNSGLPNPGELGHRLDYGRQRTVGSFLKYPARPR